jgi:four helix bundle protein
LWEKAQALAAAVVAETAHIQRSRASDAICLQLVRAAGSVPANIAEGYGRFSVGAYRNHLSIARGSLFESQSWIDLLQRTGHLEVTVSESLLHQCEEVARMLTSAMKPLKATKATIKEEGVKYEA